MTNPGPDAVHLVGSVALDKGVRPEDVYFQELGYAREARASYLNFLEARERGDIAAGNRPV